MSGAIKVISAAGGSVSITADDTLTTDEVLIVGPQVWVDEIANRVPSTDYTNNTGRPIQIAVSIMQPTIATEEAILFIDSVNICSVRWEDSGVNNTKLISITIPDKAVYNLSLAIGTGIIRSWMELK